MVEIDKMVNYTISFNFEKYIYVEDAKDETEAIKKAANHLLNLLNQGIINHCKIEIEKGEKIINV